MSDTVCCQERAVPVPYRFIHASFVVVCERRSTCADRSTGASLLWNPYRHRPPRRSPHEADAPGRPRHEQLVRVDLVGPAEEVPFRLVLGAALDREARPQA